MRGLCKAALRHDRLTYAVAVLVILLGLQVFLQFPSQEEPSTTLREAIVVIENPGLPVQHMEQLIARPVEERLSDLPEVKTLSTSVRAGLLIVQVTIRDHYVDLLPIWQRVRSKLADLAPTLPAGTLPIRVDDEFGRVAIATLAVTAPGFSMSEMREPLKQLRIGLLALPGVQGVRFHGMQQDRIYIELDRTRVGALGLGLPAVVRHLQQQNIVLSGGVAVIAGMNSTLETSGALDSVEALRELLVPIPRQANKSGATARLGDIAHIHAAAPDPPETAAVFAGQTAVVVAVAMHPGTNIEALGRAIKQRVAEHSAQFPAGFSAEYVTFQADVVRTEMGRMNRVMYETIAIVMAVVVLFLGWRAGLIVGSIVPLTILAVLIAMRTAGIELHNVSMAAIIIALGLLVDNGIVVAEDIERRLAAGELRRQACLRAGETLAIPLLASSIVIVLAFSPFFFGQTTINEYLRSLVIVLALSLFVSWLFCLTVIPLLCMHLLKRPKGSGHNAAAGRTPVAKAYRRALCWALDHKAGFLITMVLLLAGAGALLATIPESFLPNSDRPQYQVSVELPPGTDSRITLQHLTQMSQWLGDAKINPEITTSIGYVADGGPRIILTLTPPLPASHVGYFTVTVRSKNDLDPLIERTRRYLANEHPDTRAQVRRFSLGTFESGTVAYRISGPDETVLRQASERLRQALMALPGSTGARDDWEARTPRLHLRVDQARARELGVTSEDVARALASRYSGLDVTALRDADALVPVIVRGAADDRVNPEDIASTLVLPSNGSVAVPLGAVADFELRSEPSVIRRRNQVRTVTVEFRSDVLTGPEVVDRIAPQLAALSLPAGYRIELGAEIEEAAEANSALGAYLPHAAIAVVLLFIWQFGSLRKLALVLVVIPFVVIGVAPALKLSGEPIGFMVNFGLLSLAGIIVNNAVLLIERTEAERRKGRPLRDAIVKAAVMRLRPIVMTKLTCVAGLVPLMLFGGPLWSGMAITITGGLSLGTLVTLGLVPVIYEMLFARQSPREIDRLIAAKLHALASPGSSIGEPPKPTTQRFDQTSTRWPAQSDTRPFDHSTL